MIKINLLPLESFRQTASGQMAVSIFVVCMLLLVGSLYAFNIMYMSPKKDSLVKSKNDITAKVEAVKAASTKAMEQTTEFVDKVIKVSTILYLEERRRDQPKLFMNLTNEINNQTSWLVSMNHAKNVLTLKGMAIDNPTVSTLLSRLQSSPFMKNVELLQVVGANSNGMPLVSFDIKAETVFEDSTLVKQGLAEVQLPDADQLRATVSNISPDLAKSLEREEQTAKAI
jgi:Tfp pilus assembly protein PilN